MSGSKRPVSIEDLIRLKKAERPPGEFWGEFDRQLRAKQLAALVARKPWWHGLREALAVRGRLQLPIAASAAVAIAFFTIRGTDEAETPKPVGTSALSTQAADRNADVSPAPMSVATIDIPPAPTVHFSAITPAPTGLADQVMPALEPAAFSGSAHSSEPSEASTPSARFIAANLAAVQEQMGPTLIPERSGFESRALPRGSAIDPLQQMAPPGEPRRAARFVSAMASANSEEMPFRTTERVASRISPDELYDQVRRIGTRRGGLNVKF